MPWIEAQTDFKELQRCVRDLITLATLPAVWDHSGPVGIASSLATALLPMLDLEAVLISLGSDSGAPPIEITRGGKPGDAQEGFRAAFARHLSDIGTNAGLSIPHPIGGGMIRIAKEPVSFRTDAFVAAASSEVVFPTQMQRILLWIAARQITFALKHWHAVLEQRRFTSLAERSGDFIGIASVDGRPLYVNPAGCKVVGLSGVEEACKHHVLDFVMPEERHRLRDALWPIVIEKGRWVGEVAFRHFKTGRPIPFLVDWFRIDDAQTASPINIATVSRNLSSQKFAESRLRTFNQVLKNRVTERTAALEKANCKLVCEMAEHKNVNARLRELQEELFHASRVSAAGQMAATLAHELNQPLTSTANLVNAARRMHDSDASNEDLHDVLAEASAEILRAGQIIHQLREFVTRGETSKTIESVTCLVEDASALVLTGSSALDVKLTVDFDPRATSVIVDRVQIQQVLVNLLKNALEAVLLSEHRELGITTARQEANMIEIAVFDTGPGFDNLTADQLFHPFVSTKRDGMGLGLSICRSIIAAHGGKLRGESRKDGGAIFRFTLPSVGED